MNTKIFRQYDGPWAKKPYPTKGCTVSGAGCGLVACTHIAIEQERYKNWTPNDLRPWMVAQGFAVVNQGTKWEGITQTLKHIGHTNVVRVYNDPMSVAFKELNKGNRIGIFLFKSGRGGSSRVLWTTCGHYVAFTNYKYENNKHWFYCKDSGGRKHDGWYSYEGTMKGVVYKMWIVERINPIKATVPTVKPTVTADGKLVIDGVGDSATVKAMQKFFGTTVDGVISGQNQSLAKWYPALKSVKYGKGGSVCVRYMQKWLGITQDGIWGKGTSTALQKKLGVTADGIFGAGSMKAWQKYLNEHDKATYPAPKPKTIVDKELEACKTQSVWMKNASYKWESKPTIEKSKKRGTCVTYVACVLQRIGILKSGEYIWQNGKGYGTGKVYGTNSKMTVTYMGNKTLSSLKSKLKNGDIVLVDDNKSGEKGSGGHIFILTGQWSGNDPYIWDNETSKKGQKARTYSGKRKVLAVVRLK